MSHSQSEREQGSSDVLLVLDWGTRCDCCCCLSIEIVLRVKEQREEVQAKLMAEEEVWRRVVRLSVVEARRSLMSTVKHQ
jgi:hypothetical protein